MPSPSTLDFSSQDMHQPSTLPVNFTNTSMTPTTVSQAAIVGQDASSYSIASDSCSQTTIQPGGMCSIYVKFYALPAGPGPKEATLTVTDDNGTNTGTNDVALSGTAITGTLSSDQNTLDFGGLVVDQGNSNQQHVTISDDLSAGVDVSNVQIIGAGASSFYVQNNGCPYNLQRGNTCQIYVQFQPNSAGPQRAQLQIDNDGNTNPLLVSLTGDGLTGPSVTVSPPQAVYGNVALGSQASKRFTLSNDGDAPLQIQAMFLAAGSPQVFPIRDNNCLDRQIAAGNSCRFTVGFIPIAVGDKDGSVFVISNASNPGVTTIGLDGTGASPAAAPTPKPKPTAPAPAPALDGTATIAGAVQAGRRLACTAHSYPPGTRYSYRWLRDGKPIPGALGRRRVLGDADVGTRLACRVTATGPGGSQTVTSRGDRAHARAVHGRHHQCQRGHDHRHRHRQSRPAPRDRTPHQPIGGVRQADRDRAHRRHLHARPHSESEHRSGCRGRASPARHRDPGPRRDACPQTASPDLQRHRARGGARAPLSGASFRHALRKRESHPDSPGPGAWRATSPEEDRTNDVVRNCR